MTTAAAQTKDELSALIGLPLQDQDGESDDQSLEILDQVTLKHFTANPPDIDPFGVSTLGWRVDGPAGFRVRMDGVPVAKSGTRSVQPRETRTFRLHAFAGRASKFLGSATVSVNLAQCITRESSLIDELVAGVLKQEIDKRDDIYFRGGSKPQVTIAPNRIRFILRLASVQNNFPDPSVDIDVSFGLGVAADDIVAFRRKLVPVAVSISVGVSVPWWAWLIPGLRSASPSRSTWRATARERRCRSSSTGSWTRPSPRSSGACRCPTPWKSTARASSSSEASARSK